MYHIVKSFDDYSFLIRNEYTGMKYRVEISEPLRHLYDNMSIFTELPEACPFFRRNDLDGLWYCTVHLTRPDVCQEYGCWRFLILDKQGKQAGKVMGNRHLQVKDPELGSVWENQIRTLDNMDDSTWDQKMKQIIQAAGYDIRE